MGVKRRNSWEFNWSSTNPAPYVPNSAGQNVIGTTPTQHPSAGVMSGTNTIYSNIQDISNTDNQGLELSWTGTPTGTLQVLVSESGVNFYPLTFSPSLGQPAGSSGGYVIDLNQVPWRYLMLQYVNASGSGSLTAWLGSKDIN